MPRPVSAFAKSQRVASVEQRLADVRKHWKDIVEYFPDREDVVVLAPLLDKPVAWFAADLRGPARVRLNNVWTLIKSIDAQRNPSIDNSPHRQRTMFFGRLVWWAEMKWDKLGYNERAKLAGVPVIVEKYKERFPEGLPDEDRFAYAGEMVRHLTILSEGDLERVYKDASPSIGGAYGVAT